MNRSNFKCSVVFSAITNQQTFLSEQLRTICSNFNQINSLWPYLIKEPIQNPTNNAEENDCYNLILVAIVTQWQRLKSQKTYPYAWECGSLLCDWVCMSVGWKSNVAFNTEANHVVCIVCNWVHSSIEVHRHTVSFIPKNPLSTHHIRNSRKHFVFFYLFVTTTTNWLLNGSK